MLRPVILLLSTLWSQTSAAAPPSPAQFFDDEVSLTECGTGEVRALRFFRVGEARLSSATCDDIAPPLRLVFQYRRDIPGDAFGKAAETLIARNLDDERFRSLLPQLREFNRHYRDISHGDTYQLDYDRDGRLLLSLNGDALTLVQDDAFAQAYLLIWFGEQPYSTDLKRSLLGR